MSRLGELVRQRRKRRRARITLETVSRVMTVISFGTFGKVQQPCTYIHNVVACASRLEGSTFDFSWNLHTNNALLNEFSSNIPIGTKRGGTCTIILR